MTEKIHDLINKHSIEIAKELFEILKNRVTVISTFDRELQNNIGLAVVLSLSANMIRLTQCGELHFCNDLHNTLLKMQENKMN